MSISSGLRYDLAVEDPEYVRELVTYHVGGYLKIAPEHSEEGTLSKMMKPGMGTYDAFKKMFDRFSREAGKKQYLIPYFIAAHPGCEDEDMVKLAQWLNKNEFKVDQVQTFYPSPMSLATAMYHSDRNPLKQVSYKSDKLYTPKNVEQRKVQKALLRYHDPENWPLLRQVLPQMGHSDLIGYSVDCLLPPEEPEATRSRFGNGKRNATSGNRSSARPAKAGTQKRGASAGRGKTKPKGKPRQRSLKPR